MSAEYLTTAELWREPEGTMRTFVVPAIEVTMRRDRAGQWMTVSRSLNGAALAGLPSVRLAHPREAVR